MIALSNVKVRPEDHVYILGGVCVRNEKPEEWYLKQLNGHKHLICGNHDSRIFQEREDDDMKQKKFIDIERMKDSNIGNFYVGEE